MRGDKNKYEVQLLESDPTALVAHYQSIVEIVVSKFITKGFFRPDERMDIIQNINTQLLEKKIRRIKENFNGTVYLSTYFSKVVYNACLELARQQQRQPRIVSEENLRTVESHDFNVEQKMVVQDELGRMEGLLRGIVKKRTRKLICLKLFARILLTDEDLGEYRNAYAKDELAMVRTTFYDPYDRLMDKEVYEIVVLLFNKLEDKKTDPDSLRKWVNMQVDKLIKRLNGDPPRAAHTRETLKILLQLYYERKF